MTFFRQLKGKTIRLTDDEGSTFTGAADPFPAEHGLREYGKEEEGIRLGGHVFWKSRITDIKILPTCEEAAASIPPGRYRHFMGNEYEVIAIARHSETGESLVVYKALAGAGEIRAIPADMWNDTVERNGKKYRRFYRLDRIERVEKYERLFDRAVAQHDPEAVRQLDAYYTSGEWLADYQADERGELPPDLKRGVLSQDALYDLLSEETSGKSDP